ncbi:MAG: crossover junction endodeoxyribonuclease RuvC [Pseudobdellovibrionaceae bacterium]
MIIFGIDPGSRITGFGVVECKNGTFKHINHGAIHLETDLGFPERMLDLSGSLQGLLQKYQPQVVVIEKIFLGKNADSAFKLGHARGVALLEAARSRAQVVEYATRIVKKGLTGHGGADKESVQLFVQRILGLQEIRQIDASDALALALYHGFQVGRPQLKGVEI